MRGEWIIFNNTPRSAVGLKIVPGFYAKRVLLSVVCVLIAALFSSCGLPTSEYLAPPQNFSYENMVLSLTHNPLNDSVVTEFRGYEIYYRLFEKLDDANNALAHILLLSDSSSPDQFMQSIRTLLAGPFFRMQKSSGTGIDSSLPLLPAPNSATEFTYTIDMNSWQAILPDTSKVTLLRTNNQGAVASLTFNNAANYNSNDQDYSGSASPSSVYLVLFAVAYGTSASSFSEVYSSPTIIPSSINDPKITINFK